MELMLQYTRKRSEFGRFCELDDMPARLLDSFVSATSENEAAGGGPAALLRRRCVTTLDCAPEQAEHVANTDGVQRRSIGVLHRAGGWPENVDADEPEQVDRYLKRANKEPPLRQATAGLAAAVSAAVRQNAAVDAYEEYFADYVPNLSSESPSAKGVAVFRDPAPTKRASTSVSWHPEGTRLAVAYSVLCFKDARMQICGEGSGVGGEGGGDGGASAASYVWDVETSNFPAAELASQSPLVCLRFNTKMPDVLVGGCYNGLVTVFDVRAPRATAVRTSSVEFSHHDPVYDVVWVQSKTNSQFSSVSTDGRLLWWDTRKLSEPTDALHLAPDGVRVLGGCALEYSLEAGPAKYLVGTEQGIILQINMRKRAGSGGGGSGSASAAAKVAGVTTSVASAASAATTAAVPGVGGSGGGGDTGLIQVQDYGYGAKHQGPVYSVHRSPLNPAIYLTVGDWSARVWSERNRSPILTLPYSRTYLTKGCWSPTRPGVFFTARMDGVLSVWDLMVRQGEPIYSHKVTDTPISSLAVQGSPAGGGGRLVALGDANGTVSLIETSSNLAVPPVHEKSAITAFLERESKREENLEKRAAALLRAARAAAARGDVSNSGDDAAVQASAADAAMNAATAGESVVATAIAAAEAAFATCMQRSE